MSVDRRSVQVQPETRQPGVEFGRRAAQTTRAILDAAKIAFRDDGYAETTIDSIARKAETSRASIYTYFKSKRDILVSIAIERNDRYQTLVEDFVTVDLADVEAVAVWVERYVDVLDDQDSFAFVWRDAARNDEILRKESVRQNTRAWRIMGAYLAPSATEEEQVAKALVITSAFELSWYFRERLGAASERGAVSTALTQLIMSSAEPRS